MELVQPPDTPAAILIKWPPQPTVTDPAKLTATVAAIVRVLGMAQLSERAPRGGFSTEHCEAPTVYFGDFAFALDQRYAALDAALPL